MKQPVPFLWVDVFAETPLGGNPLAVLDGADLSEEALLPLTRELNLSETVFYYPPSQPGATARIRIFSLAKEVPFAGHPVLGAAVALMQLGRVPFQPPSTEVVLELSQGPIVVTVTGAAEPERARLRHRHLAVPVKPITDDRLHWLPPALGLAREQLGAEYGGRELYPQVVSGGALQLMVPVQDPAFIDHIVASYRDVITAERLLGAELGMLAFALLPPAPAEGDALRARARFFGKDAPGEDFATGSAALALAVYLHHHGLLRPGQILEIDQGPAHGILDDMPGRRSLLRASCDGESVEVEGRVREVLRGELRLQL